MDKCFRDVKEKEGKSLALGAPTLLLNDVFFERNGKNFAVSFIRRKNRKKTQQNKINPTHNNSTTTQLHPKAPNT
jgi:hypothetical protein